MAVMTQERLLRLLQKVKNVSFDYVIIDEAHSLLHIVQDYSLRKVKTEAGKICFMNNITEFDIFCNEENIEIESKKIKEKGRLIDDTNLLFDMCYL